MPLKLMVVDNDPEILKLIRNVVEPLGYETLTLTDSLEAAQRVKRQRFDGVLLNAQMPHLDGYSLTREIRSSPSNNTVPIATLTSGNDIKGMRAAFRVGVTCFLRKPLDTKKLKGLLKVMHGPMLREKRRRVRLPVQILVDWEAGGKHFKSTSLNVSERRMLVELSNDIAVGDVGDVHFILPQIPEPLDVRAKVVRKESPNHVAIQFLEVNPKARKALGDFIAGMVDE